MLSTLICVFLCLVLAFPTAAIAVDYVGQDNSVYSIDHKPKHDDKGKHKGWKKGKGPHGPGHNPPGHNNPPNPPNPPNNPPPQPPNNNPNPPDPPNNNGPGPGPGPDRNRPDRPRVDRPNTPEGGPDVTVRERPFECVVIIKPPPEPPEPKTRIIEKEVPITKIEKVLYGTGIIAGAVTIAGVLMLLIGFIIGWFRKEKEEAKFLDSVVSTPDTDTRQ